MRQLRDRLNWLQGLGMASCEDGIYQLNESGEVSIASLINRIDEQREAKRNEKSDLHKRFFSVEELTGDNLLMMARTQIGRAHV